MDDFGTGYGSLSYLRSFPFDKIKIDRAFISDIECTDESKSIVEAIVGLGKNLGMATLAEGIENFEQLKMVQAWGCAQAQGDFFSPPVPANEVDRILKDPFGQAVCTLAPAA
jgi:EAL domain-containing protein (putative c-di-GMP-specific phosphodiesterase class I)